MKHVSDYTDDEWIKQFTQPGLVEQCSARVEGERVRKVSRDIDPDDRASNEALQSIMEAE